VYCAVVLDVFSRRVVGWSIDSSPTTALVTNAPRPTIAQAVRNAPIRPLTAWKIARALSAGEVPIAITGLMAEDS
jgi:transposase InsO family protein